jgi:hypothetical protein
MGESASVVALVKWANDWICRQVQGRVGKCASG